MVKWNIQKIYRKYRKYKIRRICRKHGIRIYTINDDGSIDVIGNVYLHNKDLIKLPLKFNKVSGNFYCHVNKLETLEGSPKEVSGDFICHDNRLTSLKGAPLEIGGNFLFNDNRVDLDYNNYLKSVKRVNKLKEL